MRKKTSLLPPSFFFFHFHSLFSFCFIDMYRRRLLLHYYSLLVCGIVLILSLQLIYYCYRYYREENIKTKALCSKTLTFVLDYRLMLCCCCCAIVAQMPITVTGFVSLFLYKIYKCIT